MGIAFLIIALAAILLYVLGYKVSSLIILFFFLTDGFDLVPEEFMDTGIGFSKGIDFSLIIMAGLLMAGGLTKKDYFKIDTTLGKVILVFLAFVFVAILNSKYIVGLSLFETLRSSRFLLLLPLYFVFRSLEKDQVKMLLNACFYVTVFTSFLYILQLVIDRTILNEGEISFSNFLGYRVKRYYNQPAMVHFFAFMALYNNPIKGNMRYLAIIILLVASFGAFHRSWNGFFIMALCIGYVTRLPRLQRIKIFTVTAIIAVPLVVFAGHKFTTSRTYNDISKVVKGELLEVDFDFTELKGATFTYRMAHLFERVLYLSEHPKAQIIGAGFIPEDSRKVDQLFDFKVGLLADVSEETVQTETSDITYSVLFLRLGYLGTFLYLMIYFYLAYYFYKKRENKYAYCGFLFLILSFGVSFFSANFQFPINYILPLAIFSIVNKDEECACVENKPTNE